MSMRLHQPATYRDRRGSQLAAGQAVTVAHEGYRIAGRITRLHWGEITVVALGAGGPIRIDCDWNPTQHDFVARSLRAQTSEPESAA